MQFTVSFSVKSVFRRPQNANFFRPAGAVSRGLFGEHWAPAQNRLPWPSPSSPSVPQGESPPRVRASALRARASSLVRVRDARGQRCLLSAPLQSRQSGKLIVALAAARRVRGVIKLISTGIAEPVALTSALVQIKGPVLLLHTPLFRATAARRTLELCWAGLHTATLRGVHITLHLLLGDRSGLGRDAVGVVTTKNSP